MGVFERETAVWDVCEGWGMVVREWVCFAVRLRPSLLYVLFRRRCPRVVLPRYCVSPLPPPIPPPPALAPALNPTSPSPSPQPPFPLAFPCPHPTPPPPAPAAAPAPTPAPASIPASASAPNAWPRPHLQV